MHGFAAVRFLTRYSAAALQIALRACQHQMKLHSFECSALKFELYQSGELANGQASALSLTQP